MKKHFLLFLAAFCSVVAVNAEKPTIIIDGDNSEWINIPMLSKPGEFPVIKVATAEDAIIGDDNAFVYMIQSDVELDQTWDKYPTMFIDKDYNAETNPISCWQYTAMGVDYMCTTGVTVDKNWISFPKAISDYVIEIAVPKSYVTDLEPKFGIGVYYGSELWYSPQYNSSVYKEIDPKNGWLYKHRTISDLCGKHTADEATTHQSIGDATTTIDFGLRDNGYDTARWAAWPVSMETPIQVKVSADVASTNGWKLQCYLVDMKTNAVVDTTNFSSQSAFTGTKELGKWDLTSHPAGSYMLMLKNRTAYSRVQVNSITLDYVGGAVVDIPRTLPIADAILSSGASRVEGYIDFASESNDNARWNIHVPGAIGTKVTIDVKNASGHRYYVYVYDKDDQLVKMVRESSWNKNEGVQELGSVAFPAEGNYYVIVADSSSGSSAVFKDLTFASAGGAVVDIPGTLPVADAILSSGASVNEAGYIAYASATQDNARWNINATKAGSMSVTMDVAATDGHTYMVALYSMEGDSITAVKEKEWTSASGIMNLVGTIAIPQAGNYYVVVKNTVGGSTAVYKDVTFTYAGGGIVEIPDTLLPADAMLSEKAFIDNDTIIFAPRDAEGLTPDGWAKWNVTLEKDALCSFKANCHRFSGNTMKIKISVINSENDTIYQKEENVENSGDSEVALGNIMLAAGDYVIQMQNTVEFSSGRLMSVVVTAQPIITITDNSDIDFTDYAGQMVTVQLMRTFKANMWNPICLPFGVEHSKLQSILNCETSYLLNNASLENQKLFVELAASQYNDIYNGSPYMIKPSEDVENPIFENVKIMDTPHATSSEKGVLKLQGSFIKQTIDNPQNALLVGANNTLFFPNDAPYIKSMRAYFILKDVEPSQMPRFAAFVEPGNAPTEMIIVGGEAERQKGHRKVLVDGQIRIQHEGKCYSILGLER